MIMVHGMLDFFFTAVAKKVGAVDRFAMADKFPGHVILTARSTKVRLVTFSPQINCAML
jgi:hypothetical protein